MRITTFFALLALAAGTLAAQTTQPSTDAKQELAFGLGELSGASPVVTGGALSLTAGAAIEGNYARKWRNVPWGGVYFEIEGLVDPLRHVTGTPATATSNIRSLYIAPGMRLKFLSKERVSPWVALGGGYAFFDAADKSISGGVTGGGSTSNAGTKSSAVGDFGAGMDINVRKDFAVRGGIRALYSGSPNFGTPVGVGNFSFVASLDFVWKFAK